MGYLTTITIHNDGLHDFKKDPKKFAEVVFAAMELADRTQKAESAAFGGYCNYIEAQPAYHADDTQLYLHSGNGVFNLNPHRPDMQEILASNPKLAQEFIDRAQRIVKEAKSELAKKTS